MFGVRGIIPVKALDDRVVIPLQADGIGTIIPGNGGTGLSPRGGWDVHTITSNRSVCLVDVASLVNQNEGGLCVLQSQKRKREREKERE
jgi:hypothetical protein